MAVTPGNHSGGCTTARDITPAVGELTVAARPRDLPVGSGWRNRWLAGKEAGTHERPERVDDDRRPVAYRFAGCDGELSWSRRGDSNP
jgi:hypothetical protein